MVGLVFSLARPAEERKVPKERATIILAIDVSESMAATDVNPTRLAAAKTGALAFVKQLPPKLQLGLVSFSGTATVLVNPTTDRQQVQNAINNLAAGAGHRHRRRDRGVLVSHRVQREDPIRGDGAAARAHRAALRRRDDQGDAERDGRRRGGESQRSRQHDRLRHRRRDAADPGQEIPVPVNAQALQTIASQTRGAIYRADHR